MANEDQKPPVQQADGDQPNAERREALIKLGKYTAYATPVVIASVSAVSAAPISNAPPPPPPPTPTPSAPS